MWFRFQEALNRYSKIMEKNDFRTTKYVGLSYLEYQVILFSYKIEGLLCFDENHDKYEGIGEQELYNRGMASLYNRKLLLNEGNDFIFSRDITSAFSILRDCSYIITADIPNEKITCLYFDGGDKFVIMEPGERENEYVKVSVADMTDLTSVLTEKSYIPDSTSSDDVSLRSGFLPIEEPETEIFLGSDDADGNNLATLPKIKSIFTVVNNLSHEKVYYAGILEQTIQDKIITVNDKKAECLIYSASSLQQILQQQVRIAK